MEIKPNEKSYKVLMAGKILQFWGEIGGKEKINPKIGFLCCLRTIQINQLQKMRKTLSYSDLQKHESSCLLSDRFWCKSPEPFELQKIF